MLYLWKCMRVSLFLVAFAALVTLGCGQEGTTPDGIGDTGGFSDGGASSGARPDGSAGGNVPDTARPANPLQPGKSMSCESPGLAVAPQHIEAECAFGATSGTCTGSSGGQQGTQLQDGSTTVGYIESGDVLWYSDVALDGIDTLTLRYSKGVEGGKVEVHTGSATGTLIGTLTPTSTNGWTTWSNAKIALTSTSGTHALYLVFTGATGGILNLDWIELSATANAGASTPVIHMNHLGFEALGAKHAVVEGDAGLNRFSVVGSDGVAYYCGDLTATVFSDWGSSKSFYSVDFSELTRLGQYRMQVGSTVSPVFEIGSGTLFSTLVPAVLDYFKAMRADDTEVWAADQNVPLSGSDGRADVRGGWYDASGDISKYLTHLSFANFMNPQQIPLAAWALAWVYDRSPAALTTEKKKALADEALWGADYLLRVLNPAGFFYTNVFDQWSGDLKQRQICAIVGQLGDRTGDYQSAMREGGGMSIAALARIAGWKSDGSFKSADYLAGAQKAFDYLNANGAKYADDGKENIIDDYTALLGASELYATTQSLTYLQAARARAASLISRLSSQGYFVADGAQRPFWHASDAGLPVIALARYVEVETDNTSASNARKAIEKHLGYLLDVIRSGSNPYGLARQHTSPDKAAFFIPHKNETAYWWQGENARLASLSAAALLGARATGASGTSYLELLRFAGTQLDWILGANPYDICFVRGFGRNNPPDYCGDKKQSGTVPGGISNGITGANEDGSGIQWRLGPNGACGDEWRWVEQWIPHAAWFMVSVSALSP